MPKYLNQKLTIAVEASFIAVDEAQETTDLIIPKLGQAHISLVHILVGLVESINDHLLIQMSLTVSVILFEIEYKAFHSDSLLQQLAASVKLALGCIIWSHNLLS